MSDAEDGTLEGVPVANYVPHLTPYIRTADPAPQPADIRYEDEEPDKVANVLVVVTWADGRVKEYEAREPQDFTMNDPESVAAQAIRTTGLALGSGSGFRGLMAGVPSLRLSFSANPRYNLHIRNKRAGQVSISATSSLTNENGS